MSLRLEHADPNDPAEMSPDERRDEIASIFARALLRIPRGGDTRAEADEFAVESASFGLEVSALLRPDRSGG